MAVLKNPRHERFAQELFKGLSAERAYIAAGYANKGAPQNSSRLIRNEKVRARVEEFQVRAAKAAEVSVEKVLRELALVGFADLGNYITIRENGQAILDFSKMPEGGTRVVSEIQQEVLMPGDPAEEMPIQKTRFKLHDKLKALELIGRHLKMFTDRIENSGKIQTEDVTFDDAERSARIAALLDKAGARRDRQAAK